MRRALVCASCASVLVGCSLFVSLDGIDDGASVDSGLIDSSTDASDAGDAAHPNDGAITSDGGSGYFAQVLADSPVAYYRLDDDGPGMADFTTNHLDGVYGSAVTYQVDGLLGPSDDDTAARFHSPDGGGSQINSSVPQNSKLEVTSAISIEAWVRVVSLTNGEIASYGPQAAAPYQPWVLQYEDKGDGTYREEFYGANLGFLVGQTVLTTGTVYYMVATFDGSTMRTYLNGEVDGILAANGTTFSQYDGMTGLGIGSGPLGDAPCNAVIDEVAIYDHALAPGRIIAHYVAGTN